MLLQVLLVAAFLALLVTSVFTVLIPELADDAGEESEGTEPTDEASAEPEDGAQSVPSPAP